METDQDRRQQERIVPLVHQWIALVAMYVVAGCYFHNIFERFFTKQQSNQPSPSSSMAFWSTKAELLHHDTLGPFLLYARGRNYNDPGAISPTCVLTLWEVVHFIFYLILGFLAPDLFYPAMIVGISWEIMESKLECHNLGDILFNLSGFWVGSSLRKQRGR